MQIRDSYSKLAFLLPAIQILCNEFTSSSFLVKADWIDPDTPKYALKTHPRKIPSPKSQKTKSPTSSSAKKRSVSSDPTHSPSAPPTQQPTDVPTFSPTALLDVDTENEYDLIMSDEFNVEGRSFADGHDPKWTALDKNDYTNGALQYYSPDNVKTKNGDLIIETLAEKTTFVGFNDTLGKDTITTKNFKSAMLQSWNKFCFTGGIVEAEIQLPGESEIGGLWPAFWLLGNMARHTYVGSANHIWPWSTNVCTPYSKNAQRISGCMKAEHYGLEGSFGRGAPEIDIFEVMAGKVKANEGIYLRSPVGQPFMSASYQVAPGRDKNRPGGGYWPGPGQWYDGLTSGVNTSLNIAFYGDYNHFRGDPDSKDYWSDAVSFNHQLQASHFEKKVKYRVEWELPDEETGFDGYIRWFVNDRFAAQINGTGLVDAGYGATVSTEPMYIIMNTAVSKSWGFPILDNCPSNCECEKYDCLSKKFTETCGFPTGFCDMMTNKTNIPEYKVNYVRVWQNKKDPKQKVGCSTPERPTKAYIEGHKKLYMKKSDVEPLKKIETGGGACQRDIKGETSDVCGGPVRGLCSASRVCVCRPNWTGPNCLASVGFDPILYERKDGFADLDFTGPMMVWSGLYVGLAVMIILVIFAPTMKRRMDGWKPIP